MFLCLWICALIMGHCSKYNLKYQKKMCDERANLVYIWACQLPSDNPKYLKPLKKGLLYGGFIGYGKHIRHNFFCASILLNSIALYPFQSKLDGKYLRLLGANRIKPWDKCWTYCTIPLIEWIFILLFQKGKLFHDFAQWFILKSFASKSNFYTTSNSGCRYLLCNGINE